MRVGEIAHTLIEQAALHRLLWQQYKRGIEVESYRSCGTTSCPTILLGHAVGLIGFDFRIDRECEDGIYQGAIGLKATEVVLTLSSIAHAEGGIVAVEQACHIHRIVLVCTHRVDFQRCNDRVFLTDFHSLCNVIALIGSGIVHQSAKQQLVPYFLEIDHLTGKHLATIGLYAHRGGDISCSR